MPIIGRQPPADIIITDPRISARHAEIRHLEGNFFILTDLGSTNGSFVNGIRIQCATTFNLSDIVHLGGVQVDFKPFIHFIINGSNAFAIQNSSDSSFQTPHNTKEFNFANPHLTAPSWQGVIPPQAFCAVCGNYFDYAKPFCPRCGIPCLDAEPSLPLPLRRSRYKIITIIAMVGCLVIFGTIFFVSVILRNKSNAGVPDTKPNNSTDTEHSGNPAVNEQNEIALINDPIEPFGNIKWEDSVFQIITKLQSLEGVQTIQNGNAYSQEDNMINFSKEDIVQFLIDNGGFRSKLHDVMTYYDLQGRQRKTLIINNQEHDYGYFLLAKSVYLEDLKFKIDMCFTFSPGLALIKPNDVFTVKMQCGPASTDEDVDVPLVLRDVTLTCETRSDDPQIDSIEKRYMALASKLVDKYSKYDVYSKSESVNIPGEVIEMKFDFKNLIKNGRALAIDKYGATLEVRISEAWGKMCGMTIIYRNYRYCDELNKKYFEYHKKFEKPQGTDQSGKL